MTSLVGERRASIEGPLPLTAGRVVEWLNGGESTAAGVSVSTEGSLKIDAVWACVNNISMDIATLPLHVYKQLPRGKEKAKNHPLYRLLHDEPNPLMTAVHLRRTLIAHRLLWGNAYASVERDEDGRPIAIWPLRPDRMQGPVMSAAGTLLYLYNMPDGEPRALTQSDVFHHRGLSGDGITGYSQIALHRDSLGLSVALLQSANKFFANGSRPGGILKTANRISPEAANRMKASWEAAHLGLTNSHRVAVLEEGVEWQQIGIPPEDAQYLETQVHQVQVVARMFRMQPHKIQELSRATYSNIEEQELEYGADTLGPEVITFEQQVNKDLLMPSEKGRYFAEHLMDARLRSKTLERYQAYALLLDRGVLSPNDVLEKENMNPFEGGDIHLQQANMVPYGTEPEPTAPPAAPDDERQIVRELVKTPNGYRMIERREGIDEGLQG